MTDFPYLIQNRTSTSMRVEFTKYGGSLSFPLGTPATYVGNTTYSGFCLSGYTDPVVKDLYDWIIQLSSFPLGLSGRVTLIVDNTNRTTVPYSLGNSLDDRVSWFNQNFGTYVFCSGSYHPAFYALTDSTIEIIIEDDDIDYTQIAMTSIAGDQTLTIEPYRLTFAMKPDYSWVPVLDKALTSISNIGDLDLTYCRYRTDYFNLLDELNDDIVALENIHFNIQWIKGIIGNTSLMWNVNESKLMWTADLSNMWSSR